MDGLTWALMPDFPSPCVCLPGSQGARLPLLLLLAHWPPLPHPATSLRPWWPPASTGTPAGSCAPRAGAEHPRVPSPEAGTQDGQGAQQPDKDQKVCLQVWGRVIDPRRETGRQPDSKQPRPGCPHISPRLLQELPEWSCVDLEALTSPPAILHAEPEPPGTP